LRVDSKEAFLDRIDFHLHKHQVRPISQNSLPALSHFISLSLGQRTDSILPMRVKQILERDVSSRNWFAITNSLIPINPA
jgi:hypothetical protein